MVIHPIYTNQSSDYSDHSPQGSYSLPTLSSFAHFAVTFSFQMWWSEKASYFSLQTLQLIK